jgi:endonuclease YncB( thermonuclease family)
MGVGMRIFSALRTGLLASLVVLASALSLAWPQAQAAAQSAPPASEWATVLNFASSDKLLVQGESGLTYKVQYLGIRGPVRSSNQNVSASAFHGPLALGQRVLLQSDGRDNDGGYALRHAYLEGDQTTPIAAKVLAAGWAMAVPYPVEHRHRELFLQAQQQAMAAQANLWQPGVFGPAAPWRPAGSTATSYVPADPELFPAFDLLYTTPTGKSILDRLVRTAPPILFRDLPMGLGGYANPIGHYIVMSRGLSIADPHSLAAAIAHEATHTVDYTTGELQLTNFGCFDMEQRAHGIQAQVWLEFYGPSGRSDPRDEWDRASNNILRFAQRSDLENYVRRSPGYLAQCAEERLAI